ncbi:MAG: T9SS type A sorting domain-containing protein [Tannerella sp.]|jgi:ligand-binding sensor domain-containing protein|nr:T9SS type A sorting domain-containing protein [Tannerella sp.]
MKPMKAWGTGGRKNILPAVLCSVCLLFILQPLAAQRVGEWRSYLSGYNTTGVAEANNRVFALADGTLYSYGKEDNRVMLYSKQTGLSDTGIAWIGYHSAVKTLLLIYNNGNIDLMGEDGIYNLPYLKNTTTIRDKEVYDVYFHNENAYVATKFGIVVIRMNKKEIAETYQLNQAVYAVCIQGESIYAATGNGLLKASLSANLLDARNWEPFPLNAPDFKEKNIRQLSLFQGALCFRADSAGVFYLNTDGTIKTLLKHAGLKGMKLQTDRLIPFTASTLYIYESLSSYETVGAGTVNDVSALKDDGTYWLASGSKGLTGIRRKAAGQYEPFVSELSLDGPKRNLASFLTFHNRKLWIAGGGRSKTTQYYNPGTLTTYKDGQWYNFDETQVNQQVGYSCRDYAAVAVDPDDETHFFVGTSGEGLLEFKDNAFVQLFNHKNSPLVTALPGSLDYRYVRVQGLCFDKDRNLWITNSEADNGIVLRKPDGTWTSLYYPGISKVYFADQILITSKGYKWVNVPHSPTSPGILVFDDRGTPDDGSDDVSQFYTSFKSGSNNAIEASTYFCMAEDLNGEIWIGTDKGPIICSAPNAAIENPDRFYCNPIIRTNTASNPEEGGNYYFLNGEEINAIAVDGGNRKWLGTSGSGVFLVSPDGMETIHHFNADNSPLYSNAIRSIAINQQTGEVFFGTDMGLISYQGEAVEAAERYSDVYAYPNPVQPAIDDQVVITGLMKDSNVKITDLSGNLIYQGKSAGGQLAWNCRNRSGNHVATGIYLVLASTPQGRESVVTKIAIIH